jgi:hypothetical protein
MKQTLLAMMNYSDHCNIKSVIGKGKVLWQAKSGFEWIGSSNGAVKWKAVYIIRYSNPTSFQRAIKRFHQASFADLQLHLVKPRSYVRIKAIQLLMRFFLPKIPLNLSSSDINVENLLDTLNSPNFPSSKQFSLLLEEENKPVEMLNLLKYRHQPVYPPDFSGKKKRSGEEAYSAYGTRVIRVVAKLGGYITHMGSVEGLIDGELIAKDWEEYAIMRYPSCSVLRTMFSLNGSNQEEGAIHRDAGIEKTRVYAFDSIY